ncbi:2-amino-4-hydroxy-6-hydroxymethyldihydropteridine diphosphokinase [Phragmitibacter flavus]|uniref:2-amino-4-hydroxy-6-hydroxymethyldihydropteridine pyrophosphokinase n=1 Tax=Phragmitibacter flavus TaxID=2576071 RepID=A0A5R8KG51_9BACT|nr:2-amino-4-hydroxy-6-hydroxymethyldihydropteridine diphosphokinase [Phragmitibacter flavus]TLD70579.1 2-amino-4-hydroxy-6-hydroxymethyldihydropteridine diphosphokinase [Phragmitibacter flavus]
MDDSLHPSSLYIALGSNLGDRTENLRRAVTAICQLPGTHLIDAAPLYETDPVDCPPDSQPFYNSVIEIRTTIALGQLLRLLRGIESRFGRRHDHGHNAPRTIDLDILCSGELVLNTPELTIPHPRMTQRAFVLQPLADLHPGLILPGHDDTVCSLLENLTTTESPLLLVDTHWL